MRPILLLLGLSLGLAVVPSSAAAPCDVYDSTPPTGGVSGMTYEYAVDVVNLAANEGCAPSGEAGARALANRTCQYLVGLDCA